VFRVQLGGVTGGSQDRPVLTAVSYYFYFWLRLDAFRGLTLVLVSTGVVSTWVARLHGPFFHFFPGSAVAEQYQPDEYSTARLHPWQASTMGRQTPPLYEQPLAVISGHSVLALTVEHCMINTSFIFPFLAESA
jgi:hypothetical protein